MTFRKVLKGIAIFCACCCAFAVLGIVGALDGGAALDIVLGAFALTACGGIFAGLAYLI